jgi:two-component system, chemotaxis family, CheB/CheR fusion protein
MAKKKGQGRKREAQSSASKNLSPDDAIELDVDDHDLSGAVHLEGDGEDVHGREIERPPFPVVGVGASAGGLEACSELIESLPANIGFPIILVQHLAPARKSNLPDLLGAHTPIPVIEVRAEMAVDPGKIYVIPPNVQLEVKQGRFHLSPRPSDHVQQMPIDVFFRSLAEYAGEQAVGIVLSGTATDGSMGLRDIKASGGITFAQTPETAKYDGMPRAAIAAEGVDLVLSPAQIARELGAIAKHRSIPSTTSESDGGLTAEESQLARIFSLLRASTGVDFNHYKPPTIRRRLRRRMTLHKLEHIDEYIKYLHENPPEVQELYRDILIHVTRFFREPDSFDTLKQHVYPTLIEERPADQPIRVWIPGCSTGEEAYSVAISLLEFLGERALSFPVQVFATDVGETAIDRARAGIYPENIAEDVSADRLRKYFTRVDGSYQISKSVRGMCVFARQDLTRDPPFSRLDLIVCRNVLIYLAPAMQKKLMTIFHYALRPNGFLVLGAAETVGPHSDLFTVADKKHRVYVKKVVDHVPEFHFPVDYALAAPRLATRAQYLGASVTSIQDEANRLVLEKFGPPGVLVGPNLQVIQFRGQTGTFLEPAPGEASFNLLRMAKEGILFALRTALRDAKRTEKPVRREGLQVQKNGGLQSLALDVIPFGGKDEEKYFLVLFHEREHGATPAKRAESKKSDKGVTGKRRESEERMAILQQELAANREHLQAIIQDLEAANEELQSANEEILSSNEELQSTNEELDTAKEELQSTNEELNTVNSELHSRNDELRRINSDLMNLLSNVEIAIVMVDSGMRIRRFTPMAEKLLNLIAGDVGRPINHIKPNIACTDLETLMIEATEKVQTISRDVQDHDGRWYAMRIRPYRSADNRIDGAVLTIFDIDSAKRQTKES